MEQTVIHRSGDDPTDWILRRLDGNLEMAKQVPYDGTLRFTTETRRHVSYRKNSQFNLSESEVLDRYEDETGVRVDA